MSAVELRYNIEAETPNLSNNFGGYSMFKTTTLTQARLKEILKYDTSTGIFTRIHGSKGYKAGIRAGTKINGYISCSVDKSNYQAHRLAWLYVYGEFPDTYLDHINGDRGDNRISNLRTVTMQGNNKNLGRQKRNVSGTTGVTWDKSRKSWTAHIVVDYKTINLGRFKDLTDAVKAREEANIKYDFHPNHGKEL